MSEKTQRAAGRALLHHVSPQGGSYGRGVDEKRAEEVAKTITGPELLALLESSARWGAEEAERSAGFDRYRFVEEVRRLAVESDSLALYLFLQKEDRA